MVLAVAVALALGGGVLALQLRPDAAAGTFVSKSSGGWGATQRYYRTFGEEPIQVLVHGSLQQLLLSGDIGRLAGLEGCLAGKVPAAALASEGGPRGPCGQLAALKAVKVVLGPGTFINEAAIEVQRQFAARRTQAEAQARQSQRVIYSAAIGRGLGEARARSLGEQARKATLTSFAAEVTALAIRFGLRGTPSLSEPHFVSSLVFDSEATAGTPKPRFAYLFPSRNAALVSVRLRAGQSEARRSRAISLIRAATAMPLWRLHHGESYLVTGEPVIVSDLTSSITRSVVLLLVAVALVMAIALGLVFRGRPRLLPLAIALLACALTFGALWLTGSSLTLAQVAVLPVLVGLAVDYAIQLQARAAEELSREGPAPDPLRVVSALRRAAAAGGTTIAAAGAAGAAALLVVALSPVPTVRGFAVMLVAGIAIAFFCALTVGSAAIALAARPRGRGRLGPAGRIRGALDDRIGAAWRGAGALLIDNPLTRAVPRLALSGAARRPWTLLGAGLLAAAIGWGLSTQTAVQTDITKLVPQSMPSLQALNTLEREAGVGGEIDLMVRSPDLTSPRAIAWMTSYQAAVLKRFGYSRTKGCGQAQLCPAFSLPDLFGGGALGGSASAPKLTQRQVSGLLAAIPPYFSQDVISSDRHVATLAFGIRLMDLSQQQRLIEAMRAQLHPPRGIEASLVGLPVLAAAADAQVSSVGRRTAMLLLGLAAAALVLLVAFGGDRRRALVPLLPVVLASGWSALILFLVRLPLNPMSVTLGTLVIAVCTEFAVLFSERYRSERRAGHEPGRALALTFSRAGAPIAASAATAIAGFAVLVLSDINMLRDFGLVTVIDLTVSLLGVAAVLPAALLLSDRGELVPSRAVLRELRAAAAARLRRGRRATGHETAV